MSGYSKLVGQDPYYQELKRNFKNKYHSCKICRRYTPYHQRTVDHIIPMWQYDGSPYDMSNWQVICNECHKLKTALEGAPVV